MTPQFCLTSTFRDAPGEESESMVTCLAEARDVLRGSSDMLDSAYLTDSNGDVVADTEMLV